MLTRRVVLGAAFASLATGCYGKFALTKKLHGWNGTLGNKFVNTFVFWLFLIIPVYGVCTFVDGVILNLIEFWTGQNPMASMAHEDGTTTRFARLSPDTVRITRELNGEVVTSFDVVLPGADAALVRDERGRTVGTVEALADGSLAVSTRGAEQLVSPGRVRELAATQAPVLAVAEALVDGALASR